MIAARADFAAGKLTRYAFAFIVGWIACSAFYGTLHLKQSEKTLQVVQTKVIPGLKAEAGCEHWRAETTKTLALQPTIIDPAEIPKNCPHPRLAEK